MKIVLVNDCGGLIGEEYYDTDNATEALREFVNSDNVFEIGDVIQIREN